jgi:phosphoadenosine phosphosulfate reductase
MEDLIMTSATTSLRPGDPAFGFKVSQTEQYLRRVFGDESLHIALAFSGGKDSIVLLDLCRPYREKMTVVWVDTGFAFPHIREHILAATRGFRFCVIKHDVVARWFKEGLPTELLPIDHWNGASTKPKSPRLQSWKSCCWQRIAGNADLLVAKGFNCLLTGQRKGDGHTAAKFQQVGRLFIPAPLWDWGDIHIQEYLKFRDLKLADHADKASSSMECWICPAALTKNRINFIKAFYPDNWLQVQELRETILEPVKNLLGENQAEHETHR